MNFEVFPEIRHIEPSAGSVNGGTLLTIDGTGFVSDGLGGKVSVEVGDMPCEIVKISETKIICKTPSNSDTRTTSYEDERVDQYLGSGFL